MWTIKERKSYNDAIEKKERDKRESKTINRNESIISIKKSIDKISTSLQTPKQREVLHSISRVATDSELKFINSCIKRRSLSDAQKNVLNKFYNKYKNLI